MSGSGGKGGVDAIWQQLKQQEYKTKDKTRLESLWKHVQSGSLPSKASSKTASSKQLALQQQQQASTIRISTECSQATCDALRSGLQDGSAVSQLTLALQSHDTHAVKAALQQLQVCTNSFCPSVCFHLRETGCSYDVLSLMRSGCCGESRISMRLAHVKAVQGLAALLRQQHRSLQGQGSQLLQRTLGDRP